VAINVHTNPDVQVLWDISNVSAGFDIAGNICQVYIESTVITTKFEQVYKELKEWLVGHDWTYPKKGSGDTTENQLASWVGNRRLNYKADRLDQDKIVALEALLGWTWDANDAKFESDLQELNEWVVGNEGAYPKQGSSDPKENRLGQWVGRRRNDYKNKQLDQSKINSLETLPNWNWDVNETNFEVEDEEYLRKKFPIWMKETTQVAKIVQKLDETQTYTHLELSHIFETCGVKIKNLGHYMTFKWSGSAVKSSCGYGRILVCRPDKKYELHPVLKLLHAEHKGN
jgi:hypothetical protein